jgi:hypothetical protein
MMVQIYRFFFIQYRFLLLSFTGADLGMEQFTQFKIP